MPRDPKDISINSTQRTQRRIGELDDQKDPIRLRVGTGPAGSEGKEGPEGKITWFKDTEPTGAGNPPKPAGGTTNGEAKLGYYPNKTEGFQHWFWVYSEGAWRGVNLPA